MSALPALEPKVAAFVAALDAANLPPFERGTPEQARALTKALRPPREPREIAHVADLDAHGVPVRLYRPAADVPAVILYFHAGGWVLGSVDESDAFARDLAHVTGCAVVSVDYRLAPEARYPAAVEDADAALAWLGDTRADLFGAVLPIVVMGESAGGNLATIAARHARDRGGPAIAAQVLAYPVTDARMDSGSYRDCSDGPLLTAPLMAWFWDHYLPDIAARGHPDAAPLGADLAGLPPSFVLTASHDPLRDEGEAYATALATAGVPVRAERYDGQIHMFVSMAHMFDGGAKALADIAGFIRETV